MKRPAAKTPLAPKASGAKKAAVAKIKKPSASAKQLPKKKPQAAPKKQTKKEPKDLQVDLVTNPLHCWRGAAASDLSGHMDHHGCESSGEPGTVEGPS